MKIPKIMGMRREPITEKIIKAKGEDKEKLQNL